MSAAFELPPLPELSAMAATDNPNRTAFGEGAAGETITWREFEERSRRAAGAFAETCAAGDRVAFLCDCSIEHVTLWNGAMKAGCVVSNLHTRAAPETLAYCVEELRPRVVVADDAFADALDATLARADADVDAVVSVGESVAEDAVPAASFSREHDPADPDVRTREEDVACVQWTSGTTGRPKGWCHTHRGLGHKAILLRDLLDLDRTAGQAHVFTPSFAAWYSLVLPALYTGAATYFLDDWSAAAYAELIDERNATLGDLVPTMWREILALDLDAYDFGSLRRVVASGEPLDTETLAGLRERVCDEVYNSYAATEVLGTAISDEELTGERVESVGKPMAGTRVRVVEEDGTYEDTVERGERGEIVVKGPDCAVWAWNDTPRTEAAFEDGWWYSGDLGYRDEDGYLYVEGRADFVIKSKGIKVVPGPIEERLTEHPVVDEAVVVGVPDAEYGEKVVAVVRTNEDVSEGALEAWCLESETVARFERPREYRFADGPFPRTATGKLDRATVRGRVADE
ncbi:MAG: class I adenylate-forming enzyme family protein [Halarchaeum sp.]